MPPWTRRASAAARAAPGGLRATGRQRQRQRHGRGDRLPHLRAVLHDPGHRQGHRPRPRHRPRCDHPERRPHRRRQQAGARDHVLHLPAALSTALEPAARRPAPSPRPRDRAARGGRAGRPRPGHVDPGTAGLRRPDGRDTGGGPTHRRRAGRAHRPAHDRRGHAGNERTRPGRGPGDAPAATQVPVHVRLSEDIITQHGAPEPGWQFLQKPFSPEDLLARVREALAD